MKILDRLFPRRFVAHSLASHLSTPWAMDAAALARTVAEARDRIASTPAAEIRALAMGDPESRPMLGGLEADGTYWIPVAGAIIRGDASCARMMGVQATGLEELERALAYAESAPDVARIQLEVDSPGGTAVGVQEIADLIGAIAKKKPVGVEIAGLCASAAYWLVSKATTITADRSSLIGSIGVLSIVEDSSKAAEAEGVRVIAIRSAPLKGGPVEGVEVSDDMIAARKVVVDDLAALFASSVAEGRGIDAATVTSGEEWIASKALALGLIDAITAPELDAETEPPPPAGPADPDLDDGEVAKGAAEPESNIAPRGAEVQSMDELQKLQAELAAARAANEKATAERDALKATIGDIRRGQVAEVINKHAAAGRIAPSARASIEALAAKAYAEDPAGLDAFLATMPVVTNEKPAGGSQDRPEANVDAGEEALIAQAAKLMGRKVEDVRASANVIGMHHDGRPAIRAEVK